MSTNISTVIIVMGLILIFDAVLSGIFFSKLGTFLIKIAISVVIITVSFASKSEWLAEVLSGSLWFATVAAAVAVVAVVLYDLKRYTKRLDQIETRRRGSHRKTPARY